MSSSVYLCFGCGGLLLYVGCAESVERRLLQHSKKSSWFPAVVKIMQRRYLSRERALDVERRAIALLKPVHNKANHPDFRADMAAIRSQRASEHTKAGMAARKAADPTVKWGQGTS